jgi:hypothetical protein
MAINAKKIHVHIVGDADGNEGEIRGDLGACQVMELWRIAVICSSGKARMLRLENLEPDTIQA